MTGKSGLVVAHSSDRADWPTFSIHELFNPFDKAQLLQKTSFALISKL
jgi:hypothetical protein